MKSLLKFWSGWVYQTIFGLLFGFLVGFMIAIKPKGGGGILRNSDTLPFVLGMGLLFVTVITQFCLRMDRHGEDPNSCASPEFANENIHLNISKVLSFLIGAAGIALMVMSFLKTFKIMTR